MDKSDDDSNCSDQSTLSGLSDYKNEFLQLKQLIDPNKCSTLVKNRSEFNETTIERLQNELRRCRKFNETYRIENEKLRRIKLKYNEKIERLIKQNKHLQINLECANKKIQRLFDSIPLKKTNDSETKIVILEKENHNLNVEKSVLNDQITYYKQQINDLLLENADFKRKFSESDLELKTRISCIEELKEKIAKQFLDLQNLQKDNQNLSYTISNLTNDLEHLKKSEFWYKEQLHNYQDEKQKLTNEIHELKQINITNIEKIDHLHLEVTKSQSKCDEIRLESLKEKEEIFYRLDTINNNSSDSGFSNEQYDINYYETIIQDLKDEIQRIKSRINEVNLNFDRVNKENSELLSKCLLLQKYQQQKENDIEQFINNEKLLKMQLSLSLDRETTLQKQIDDLTSTNTNLQLDLLKKNEENSQIDDSIKTIKEQFRILKSNHEKLKAELDRLSKENIQLQNDKQELFMSNNWKICELNQYKNLEDEIKQLQEKSLNLIQEIHQIKHENTKLINENSDLNRTLNEKNDNLILLEKNIGELKHQILHQDRHLEHKNGILLDHLKIAENLKNLCKLFKIDCTIDLITSNEFIRGILEKLEKRCREMVEESNSFKQIFNRIKIIEKRCVELQKKTDKNFELLQGSTYQNFNAEIKYLKMLLEVKNREQKDKQKRYEKNYSVLLRKVKEHMKYRNLAEKHQKFLQEMNDSISNECNDLKMLIESKNYEMQQFQVVIENYKQTILNLERKNNKNEPEIIKNQQQQPEKLSKQSKIDDDTMKNEIKVRNSKIESLKQMNQTLILENSALTLEQRKNSDSIKILKDTIANLSNKIAILQNQLINVVTDKDELSVKLDKENNNYRKLFEENQHLTHQLDDYRERNNHLTTELKLLQSNLHQKSEEIIELQSINKKSEENYSDKIDRLQDVIFNLKIQLQTCTSDIDLLKNQKFFLQRLCNDLKIALRFHVNHCKLLQEKLMVANRNHSEISSINLPEVPVNISKYTDEYIERLLEKSQLLNKENCLGDVKASLDGLRKEISLLQKHLNCT